MIVDHVGKLFVVSISQPGDLARAVVVAATCLVSLSTTSNSAEFGASPYPKGFRDIYAGVVPTVPKSRAAPTIRLRRLRLRGDEPQAGSFR